MNNIEYIDKSQIYNLLYRQNKKPIYLHKFFTKINLSEFESSLNEEDNIIFFNTCLGGDLSLLPALVEIMSKKNCTGVVNFAASLHLAILGLCKKIILFNDSRLFHHIIKPYPNFSDVENNKLINLYVDCTNYLNRINKKHLIYRNIPCK